MGFNSWGRGAGCNFVTGTCPDIIESNDPEQRDFFCLEPGKLACTYDLTAYGVCDENSYWDGCHHVQVRLAATYCPNLTAPPPTGPCKRTPLTHTPACRARTATPILGLQA